MAKTEMFNTKTLKNKSLDISRPRLKFREPQLWMQQLLLARAYRLSPSVWSLILDTSDEVRAIQDEIWRCRWMGQFWHHKEAFCVLSAVYCIMNGIGYTGKWWMLVSIEESAGELEQGCQCVNEEFGLICLHSHEQRSEIRLGPIPEFTDTTDTDTLVLHQYRYRVPIPIPVVTSQPPGRVVSRYYAWALSRPVLCMYVWRYYKC